MRRRARLPHPVVLILMTELILVTVTPTILNDVRASKPDGRSQIALPGTGIPGVTQATSAGCGGASFTQAAGSPVALGKNDPLSIATADFNLDGKPDLATANYSTNNVSILIGNASGAFTQPMGSPFSVGSAPRQLAVGDFNRDGKPDLAVVNSSSDDLTILLGDGTGGFTQSQGSPIGVGAQPFSIAAGDFNLDGKQDLAIGYDSSGGLTILLGDGNGAFTESAGSPVVFPFGNASIAVGDFNSDGKPDLGAANEAHDDVFILLGDGTGAFTLTAGSPITVGTRPFYIALGDFNRDGKRDLAVSNFDSDNVTILLGDGSGGFTQPASSPISVGNMPFGIGVGDFNFDGKPDLAVTNDGDQNVSILFGDGAGGFTMAAGSPVAAGTDPSSIAVADFNLDGKPDLAVANNASHSVTVQLNTCNALPCGSVSFALPAPTFGAGNNPNGVATGDFNNDGKPDFAVANQTTADVSVYLGDGSGGFMLSGTFGALAGAFSVAVGDFNKDGKQDLVVADAFAAVNKVSVFLGNGDGTFAAASNLSVFSAPFQAVIGDFNRDGNPDIATANNTSMSVSVLLGNGAGGFASAVNYPAGTQPNGLAIGDFNNDGKLDIVTGSGNTNNISILLGNGTGGFAPASPIDVGRHSAKFAVGDFNNDGKQDIVFSTFSSDQVAVMLGDGLGGFVLMSSFPGSLSNGVTVGDLNGDGKQDIAYANSGSTNVSVLLGNGSGGFTGPFNFSVGDFPTWVAIADFNGDGKQDIVACNAGTADNAALLLNDCIPFIAPLITCPSNITQVAESGACSTHVTFTATATGSPAPTVTCTPASGSTFMKGTTTVTCTAANGVLPNAVCMFTVTVNDTQAPIITCPVDVTHGTDPNSCQAVVTYQAPSVNDNCAGVGSPVCTPASGAVFPKGITTVSCTVNDASMNSASCTFTVTINDTQPPNITCPISTVRPTDLNQCQAVVSYPMPSVSDNCSGVGAPSCNPTSGTIFQKGITTVTCVVSDSSNNSAMCSFTVTVADTQPPQFANGCPAAINKSAQATCPITTSSMVSYSLPIATDNCGMTPSVVCSPPSGSTFPAGTSVVTCTATDTSGNVAHCTFPVNVYNLCLRDDRNDGNVVFVNTASGAYLFCQNGVPLASGTGTLVAHGCSFQIDHTKGDRKVHIQGDTSFNENTGTGSASIKKVGGGFVVEISDEMLSNNSSCTCAPPAPNGTVSK